MNCPKIYSLPSIRQMPFYRPHFHSTSELPEADSVPAIQRRIPEFRLHPCCLGYSFFLRSHGTSFIASVARISPFWRCCKEKIFPCVFSALVGRKTPCFRPLFMQYCAILFWLNQLCVRWVIQRNKRGLAQALLAPNNQAAVLQLPEDPCGALAAAVELRPRLLQGEV